MVLVLLAKIEVLNCLQVEEQVLIALRLFFGSGATVSGIVKTLVSNLARLCEPKQIKTGKTGFWLKLFYITLS